MNKILKVFLAIGLSLVIYSFWIDKQLNQNKTSSQQDALYFKNDSELKSQSQIESNTLDFTDSQKNLSSKMDQENRSGISSIDSDSAQNDLERQNHQKAKAAPLVHAWGDLKDEIQIARNFKNHLKNLNVCLKMNSNSEYDALEPTADQLIYFVKQSLGEVIVQYQDWEQTEILLKNQKKQRIRIETSYSDQRITKKYLRVYDLLADGTPEYKKLKPEFANNPSDEIIKDLLAQAQKILNTEKGSRTYFEEGEELVIIENNQKVESFSLSKNSKTMSCSSLTIINSNCQCL